jgi:hypothetical protein
MTIQDSNLNPQNHKIHPQLLVAATKTCDTIHSFFGVIGDGKFITLLINNIYLLFIQYWHSDCFFFHVTTF